MKALMIVAGAACLLGCAAGSQDEARREALALQPTGEPVNCIQTTSIRHTKVIDARTIDFHMRNGQVLRNRLPNECPGIAFEQGFSYSPTGSQLCSVDIITVLHQGGSGGMGASCGLGSFQPVGAAGG